ncbi:MAG: beta-aspartyl-peptidase [Flavobacteriales bacterium CG18_big_fil_WC_8_21_14_2_50_32_9]|nr:isoaspartyl peptidase/L-asparaginase [Flavobacteriales bacterium]PIQ15748.1 MAG: beta-aspartyl-peptidase [Flavobacteriales bacterium CG18_big_fil_WC_8_21_14_2_50_32_9]PJC61666.1 MAG: beta-aspartyl-peptidase [Flavobacteriales bacterium CG_4_9_14_0_2_um_filter_32_27]
MRNVLLYILCITFPMDSFSQNQSIMNENFAIVIHGGAGTILKKNMTPAMEKAYQEKLQEALDSGYVILKNGGSAIDAVEKAILVMEDSPLFNAGKGAVYTNAETNELDASIMDGKSLNAGAVAGVSHIKNPIKLARMVMEKSEHVMLSGKGAEDFAKQHQLEMVDSAYFYNEHRLNQLNKIKKTEKIQLDHSDEKNQGDATEFKDSKFGTVGAVALDKHGNLAAATSTGGMTNKKFGRIGDSPIIGAGTYANNATCAVSCTGHGEFFIRNVVAYDVAALMEYKNLSLLDAANYVVKEKLVKLGGEGGLIAIDNHGNIAMPFNTKGMYRGYKKSNGESQILIFKD